MRSYAKNRRSELSAAAYDSAIANAERILAAGLLRSFLPSMRRPTIILMRMPSPSQLLTGDVVRATCVDS